MRFARLGTAASNPKDNFQTKMKYFIFEKKRRRRVFFLGHFATVVVLTNRGVGG